MSNIKSTILNTLNIAAHLIDSLPSSDDAGLHDRLARAEDARDSYLADLEAISLYLKDRLGIITSTSEMTVHFSKEGLHIDLDARDLMRLLPQGEWKELLERLGESKGNTYA